ncbi:hypothetical protein AS850_00895 [Frondihabitans sp. 762G35]|uniref:Ig-like domain-containing protein n=1 Tax=Frondihabitans sp. 762G35 TaxID=1446794 RepID=UPI000D220C00|nr:Ig-like domain-containing protein [Frondihabitans sp. 762G35]ARC55630.1 hypothetical protein AS850_00895 [Frondihabitans sp. 762G35]
MPEHAARLSLPRRALKPVAVATVVLLAALGMTEGSGVSPARAAANLSCDQNTIYAIAGANGTVQSIDATSGATAALPAFTTTGNTANNALALAPNGTAAYATVNQTAENTAGSITRYDAASGTVTAITGIDIPARTIRGAVNPATGIYYFAQGGVTDPAVYAYDPATGASIGKVGHLPGVASGNGDFAFSTSGILYVAAGAQVLRVDTVVPSTTGNVALTTSQVTALPSGTNSPGIAFSTSGYLYVASGTNLLRIDPSSGTQVGTVAIAGGLQPTDLASCNYADSISGRASVDQRWRGTDQFALEVAGDGLQYGNTATTSGTDTGLQSAVAGASLVVGGSTYTVSEKAAGTTDFADYATSYRCTNQTTGSVVATGSGRIASITPPKSSAPDDADVSCVFTNTLLSVHVAARDDSFHTRTDTQLSVSAPGVLGNDSGTGTAIVSSTSAAHGTATLDTASGAFTYQPDSGFAGTDSFTYTDQDSSGQQATATVTIVVGPTANADVATLPAGAPFTQDAQHGVLANDGGSQLTASPGSDPAHGTLDLRPDGSYTYTPEAHFSGQDSFTYTATDSAGQTSTGTVTLTVVPVAVADTLPSTPYNTPATITTTTLLANDQGAGLAVTATGTPSTGTVALSSDGSSITYTPARGTSGLDTFTYTVTDANGATSTATETIRVTPTAGADALPSTPAGTSETVPASTLLGNDRGTGLTITGVSAAANGQATVASDGSSITFAPAAGYSGPAQFDYTVTDASGGTATATASLTVTPAVSATATTAVSGVTDSVDAAHGVLSDSSGSGLRADVDTAPQHGTLDLRPDGSYDYTPAATFSGTDTFTYTATDSSGTSTPGTVTITVVPAAVDDTIPATKAGSPEVVDGTVLLANDAGAAPLSIASVGRPGHGTTLLRSGSVVYRPAAGFSGPDSFTYSVTDGQTVSAPATISVNVTPVAVDDTVPGTTAGAAERLDPSVFVANDRGTDLRVTSVGSASMGSATLNGDGSVTYASTPGFSGTHRFDYTVTDGSGQQATAVATITVAPAAGPIAIQAIAGVVDHVDAAHGLLSNASGSDLTATAEQPANGTVTVSFGGAFDYAPATGFSGTDSFAYTVTDGSGTSTTSTVTVTVAPKANPDVVSASSGTTLAIPAATLLGNDRGTALVISSVTQPEGGTVTLAGDGGLAFAIAPTFSGDTTFTYVVQDTSGGTSTTTVTVHVAPVAAADTGSTTVGTALSVPVSSGLLRNDAGSDLAAALATSPAHGSATVARDGSYAYTPAAGFSGTDTFGYTATDSSGSVAAGSVTIHVAPLAVSDTLTTVAGVTLHRDAPGVLGNDRGTGLTVTAVGSGAPGTAVTTPKGGSLVIATDGTVDYVPAAGFSGTDTVSYAIADGAGAPATATVAITVTPRAVDDSLTTPANTALDIPVATLTGNDRGTGLTVAPASGTGRAAPAHGRVDRSSTGDLAYTPDAGFSGTDTFSYTVVDADGQAATATVRVLVGNLAAPYATKTAAGSPLDVTAANGLLSQSSGTGQVARLDAAPAHGTVTVDPDGSYAYTPTAGFSGADSFTYTATDSSGQVRTGTVTIVVTPRATADTERTTAGHRIVVGAPGLLGNDSGTGLIVTAATVPTAGGTADVSGAGVLTYTPAAGFSGVETFDYTVRDSDGQDATTTVTVRVTPVAAPDSGRTTAGRALVVGAASGLLADDSGSGLTAALRARPAHGTVTVNRDGSYRYVPREGFSGVDSFTYTATDASGQITVATATITVQAGAAAADDSVTAAPNEVATVRILANDRVTPGARFEQATVRLIDPRTGASVESFALPGKGTFAARAGSVTFTPEHNFHGTASIGYRVTDTDAVTVRALVTVIYPSVVAAIVASAAAPVIGALAFTGSTGTGAILLGGALILLVGLGLVLMHLTRQRAERHAPGPRRTGA